MRTLLVLPAVALAACATTARPDSAWLVGNWCPDHLSSSYIGMRVGLWPTRFDENGQFETFEDNGTWDLRGHRLHRRSRFGDDAILHDDRVERLGSDVMAWTRGFGVRELWHRCPADRR